MDVASVVRVLASLSWVVAIGVVVLAIMRATRGKSFKAAGGLVIAAVVGALLFTTVSQGLVFIQPEERGVVISAFDPKGYREQVLQPGLRWIIPFAENVVIYPISQQTYTMSIAPSEGAVQGDDSVAARTSDGQEVLIDASVIFAIDPTQVIDVHIAWQNRYAIDLVRPLSRGAIRDAASQFRVDEIVSSRRVDLIEITQSSLRGKMEENGLLLTDFVLRNITFSPEYAASVEQKQIAEQQAQQAAFVVESRRQEAEQARQLAQGEADAAVIAAKGRAESRLIEAEAEAQALELISSALRDNPEVLTFEYIQKLAPGIQVMLVPSDAPYLLPLPELESSVLPTPLPTETPAQP